MEKKAKQAPRSRYSPEFKQKAVDRFVAGESATALARELNIRRKFLYLWRDKGFGSKAARVKAQPDRAEPPQDRQQKKIAELERLVGQQAAQLDFFAAALRAIREPRPSKGGSSATGSTRRSNK